jgi:hypothetical protein
MGIGFSVCSQNGRKHLVKSIPFSMNGIHAAKETLACDSRALAEPTRSYKRRCWARVAAPTPMSAVNHGILNDRY